MLVFVQFMCVFCAFISLECMFGTLRMRVQGSQCVCVSALERVKVGGACDHLPGVRDHAR